jgi:hypothetical protein
MTHSSTRSSCPPPSRTPPSPTLDLYDPAAAALKIDVDAERIWVNLKQLPPSDWQTRLRTAQTYLQLEGQDVDPGRHGDDVWAMYLKAQQQRANLALRGARLGGLSGSDQAFDRAIKVANLNPGRPDRMRQAQLAKLGNRSVYVAGMNAPKLSRTQRAVDADEVIMHLHANGPDDVTASRLFGHLLIKAEAIKWREDCFEANKVIEWARTLTPNPARALQILQGCTVRR